MEKWLSELFPIMDVEHDCIVSKSGSISVVFRALLPEIFGLSDDDYELIHQTWIRALKILPENAVFHKQDWFIKGKYKSNFEAIPDDDFLSRGSEKHFNERPVLDHSCYIIISLKSNDAKSGSSFVNSLVSPSIVPPQTLHQRILNEFTDKVGQFQRIITDSGFIQLTRLKNDDLLSTSNKAGYIEEYCFLSKGDPSLLVKDIDLKDGIKIGRKYCQLYSLADVNDLPALVGSRINYDKYSTDKIKFSIGFSSATGLLLPYDHIYNQYVFIGEGKQTLKKLESKKLRLQSLANYSRENAIARDAVNDFLNEAIGEQRTPVMAHFNILVWTENESELKNIKNSVAGALAQIEAVAKEEKTGAGQIFWAGIPGNAADFPLNDSFQTFLEPATCFFISESNARSSSSSFGLRLVDRLYGAPVWVDLSDEMVKRGVCGNRNKLICGASGSGKSMFMNALHRAYYLSGAHCVIVDVGHSYAGLCKLLNGYYFTYDEQNPIRFNPFYLSYGEVLDTEKKESLKTLLLALWKKDDEHFKRSEYVALSNAIHNYYEYLNNNNSVFPCFNSFYEWLRDEYVKVLQDEKVREKEFDVANFLYVLKPFYTGGEYDYLLNATERLDILSQRFIVFELDAIKDNPTLFPVVTLMVMFLFVSKMRRLKGIRKVITIEEAWKAISKSGMAEFMRYLYKTVRKHFGEANTVTQEIDDVLNSPIIKQAIINNADVKIFLDMRKFQNKFSQIQDVMGMTNKGVPMVLSLNKANDPTRKYRELYVDYAGQIMAVYAYEPSPEEYWAFTTEEREKYRVQQYTETYGSIRRAIEMIVLEEKTAANQLP
jgi:conjugation system TraG family ATPase